VGREKKGEGIKKKKRKGLIPFLFSTTTQKTGKRGREGKKKKKKRERF